MRVRKRSWGCRVATPATMLTPGLVHRWQPIDNAPKARAFSSKANSKQNLSLSKSFSEYRKSCGACRLVHKKAEPVWVRPETSKCRRNSNAVVRVRTVGVSAANP